MYLSLLSSFPSVEASRSEYLSIIQVTGDYVLSTDDPDGLFFDPTKFRANKEVICGVYVDSFRYFVLQNKTAVAMLY